MSNEVSENIETSASKDVYQCPRTGASLSVQGDSLVSDDGSVSYEMKRGVPFFLNDYVPEPDKIKDQLEQVNELAREKHWKEAVKDVYGDWDYIFPDGRDEWLKLLEIDSDDDVLEIGPGMGQFSPLISKRCKTLHGLEVVPEQAEFATERCRQEGCTNMQFASGGDDCLLPYKDNSFDWVVLNLVFEWCAMRNDQGTDFASGQRTMLSEMNRVLKPGGKLYLLTKNRYALRLMTGKHDEHCYGMKFGNSLPRPIMNFLLRRKGKSHPRGMLHSHNALKGMFKDAGFESVESFWATPEMRFPTDCVPNNPAAIRAARKRPGFVQGEFKSTRMMMRWIPAGLVKHFTPGLQMIAQKRG